MNDVIKSYIALQESKMSRIDIWCNNYPKVTLTEKIALPLNKPAWGSYQKVNRSIYQKILHLLLLLFALYMGLLLTISCSKLPIVVFIPFLLFLLFIIWIIVYNGFINKKYNYLLVVDSSGITHTDKQYTWQEVNHTAIMSKMSGRYTSEYLVLFLANNYIIEIDVSNASMPTAKIATIIEHFKHSLKQ